MTVLELLIVIKSKNGRFKSIWQTVMGWEYGGLRKVLPLEEGEVHDIPFYACAGFGKQSDLKQKQYQIF